MPLALMILVGLAIGLVVLLVLATVWQRQGLTNQQRAMARVKESLELSRRNVELGEEANALTAELLETQREMLQLLRRLVEARAPEPEPPGHAIRSGPAGPSGGADR
jgi:uncharacterized membrane-anchored protein YhcB (DUF1043 family)